MGICEQCQSLSETPVQDSSTVFRHDAASLKKAVEQRCYMCTGVWNSLSKEQHAIVESPSFSGIECHISFEISDEDEARATAIPITFSFFGEDELFNCCEANTVGGWRSMGTGQFAIFNPSRMLRFRGYISRMTRQISGLIANTEYPVKEALDLSETTNSQSCWTTVSQWIGVCCSNHHQCVEPEHSKWAPTRLVDIGEYERGHVRVVESSAISELPSKSYLALSHCWGRRPFTVLNQHNKTEFEGGIPIALLAPNFQDAIYATWKLGFRYIWIDSLCIIQESSKDWHRESFLMNKVYKNAFLTLSAMASPDAYGGFFRERDPDVVSPHPFKVLVEGQGLIEGLLIKSDLWETNIRQAPLNQRAWVVQERILAPRTLHFCQDQLFWECRELHACEVLPNGIPSSFIGDITKVVGVDTAPLKAFGNAVSYFVEPSLDANHMLNLAGMQDSEAPPQYYTPYEAWNDILALYVQCALTKSDDKLVALSGVAKDFAGVLNDEYVAGLWRRNLINGLLWQVDAVGEPPRPSIRPTGYRAPTWSWASIDGADTKPYSDEPRLYGDYAQVVGVHTELEGNDPTGGLRHACLHLRGCLIKTRRKPQLRAWCKWYFGSYYQDVDEESSAEEFFCLPLRQEPIRHDGPQLLGLVLALVKDGEEEYRSCCDRCAGKLLFTRVGTFSSSKGDPLRYLTMPKPENWDDWGGEKELLWFPEDSPELEFAII